MALVLTAGQRHEASVFKELMAQGEVRLAVPVSGPRGSAGTKSTAAGGVESVSVRRGIRHTIPRKTNERRTGLFNRGLYRQRDPVERSINRLKQFRRIVTRCEKKAENYLAGLQTGSLLLWLKFANTPQG